VVPSMVVADRPPYRITPFTAPGLSRTIGLAHRKDVQPPRAARALRDTLLAYLDQAAAAGTLPPGTRPVRRQRDAPATGATLEVRGRLGTGPR
jgi:hypothetical protein